jgi:hypothetical protein
MGRANRGGDGPVGAPPVLPHGRLPEEQPQVLPSKSQFPHKPVNLPFTITDMKNKLKDLWEK